MKRNSTTWFVNYEFKIQAIDTENSVSFSIRIRGLVRTIGRSLRGRETLVQQKPIGETKDSTIAFVSGEIPNAFLADEETCNRFVDAVFSTVVNNSLIQQHINPKFCKNVIDTSRRLGEEEGQRGFLIEAEVEIVKETLMYHWLSFDEYDSEGRLILKEEDCMICKEELLGQKKIIMKLPCSHNFHKVCILKWLESKHLCPTCGDDIQDPKPKKQQLARKIFSSKERNKKFKTKKRNKKN